MDSGYRLMHAFPSHIPLPYYMDYPGYQGAKKEQEILKDMEYLQQIYPAEVKHYQRRVAQILDKMDYEGSMIYDEYPDYSSLRDISDSIVRILRNEETGSSTAGESETISGGVGESESISGGVGESETISGGVGESESISGGVGESETISGGAGESEAISSGAIENKVVRGNIGETGTAEAGSRTLEKWVWVEELIRVLLCDEIYKRRHGGKRGKIFWMNQ